MVQSPDGLSTRLNNGRQPPESSPKFTVLGYDTIEPNIAASLAKYGAPWRGASRKIRKPENKNLKHNNNMPIIEFNKPFLTQRNLQSSKEKQAEGNSPTIWFS